jgi:tyrosinase
VSVGTPEGVNAQLPVRWRRNASALTPGQTEILRQAHVAVMAIGDDRGYAFYAGIHGLPRPIGCDNAHGSPYFLPWHRAYLYFYERALRDQVPDAALVWWDWTTGEIPVLYDAEQDDAGNDNPLFSADVDPLALQQGLEASDPIVVEARTLRQPGTPGWRPLPSAQEVADVLEVTTFLDFSAQIEELHDRVHMWTGGPDGHMGKIPFAAFDPIFWAHHTMIDRVWRLWQLRHPGALPPASLLDDALPPFRARVRQTLDVTALGYDYATSTSSTVVG